MKEMLTAVFEKSPQGYIGYVERESLGSIAA